MWPIGRSRSWRRNEGCLIHCVWILKMGMCLMMMIKIRWFLIKRSRGWGRVMRRLLVK